MGIASEATEKYADAEPIARYLLDQNRGRFGDTNPVTLDSTIRLASVLDRLDKSSEAMSLYQKAADAGRQDARDALKCFEKKTSAYGHLGLWIIL